jgi:excisionase family DNA binding protein
MDDLRRRPLGDSEEVAAYLRVSVRTLDDWAYRGVGPEFSRVGRHRRYRWPSVDRWLDEQAKRGDAA